jgi:NAD+ synthase (glutamine-hydrolysing)
MLTKEYIKQVRDLTGFSDYKIAKEYGINQSNLSKYSSGKMALSETHAFLFAEVLGINPTLVMLHAKIEHATNTQNNDKLIFWQKQLKNIKSNTKEAKIIISQFNPIVGDILKNTQKIIDISSQASAQHDLIIFPELAVCGYPPEDILWHSNFKEQITTAITDIAKYSHTIDILVGCPTFENNAIYNSALLFRKGKLAGVYHKRKLPNYGVFDEKRYFTAGNTPLVFHLSGYNYGVVICEDTWSQDVIKDNKNIGIDKIISINASPFSKHKHLQRMEQITANARNNSIEIIYVNMVGAQDNLVFDGGSFISNAQGEITRQFPFFIEQTYPLQDNTYYNYSEIENMYNALVLGLKDYYQKSGCFQGIIIALSGGIDSALTLAIASDAIGNENITAVMMPHIYTSSNSLVDARDQVNKMNISYQEIPITDIVNSYQHTCNTLSGIALENIQARIRGNIVMSIANMQHLLLLSTSNKSESSVGYTTLYGDMSGGFSPIKDVYKTDVYKLAHYRNTIGEIIPENVLRKPPTAELAENQFDTNTLPPYEVLDAILELFVEQSLSIDEIVKQGFEIEVVKKVIKMVKNNEYKRFQSALGTKISEKSFDKERRYPIVHKFKF